MTNKNYSQRESGIELLKIIAIFLLVFYHVILTLNATNTHYSNLLRYMINYNIVTNDIQSLILAWLSMLGQLGNKIFFICSAWFLLDDNKIKIKKIWDMLVDVWVISISLLLIMILIGYSIDFKDIIRSLFPTIFSNNWYITCYALFYLIHGKLNLIIKNLSKKELFCTSSVMFVLYFIFGFLKIDVFFTSSFIIFIAIYFIIAYIKLYLKDFSENIKENVIILIINLVGTLVLLILTNIIGFKVSYFQDQLLRWNNDGSPFILMIAISMFNIFKSKKFVNQKINMIDHFTQKVY